jgi:hypothetical protein
VKRSGFLPRKTPLKGACKLRPAAKRKPSRAYQLCSGVQVFPDAREVCLDTASGRREYKRRTKVMGDRQGWLCAICGEPFDSQNPLRVPTFDHERARGAGGGFRDDSLTYPDGRPRNAALCYVCQGFKGSRRFEWRGGNYQPYGGR